MYIALWIEERLVSNPYYDRSLSNIEPAQVKEPVVFWKKLFSDKELMDFLDTSVGSKAEYYNASEIFPELEKTVTLRIIPSVRPG